MLCLGTHALGKTDDLSDGLAFHAQRCQQRADLRIGCAAAHDDIHGLHGLLFRQVVSVYHLCRILAECLLRRLHLGSRNRNGNAGNQIEEVGEHPFTLIGEDGFRMELHAVSGMFPVCQRHDLAVLVTCRHFQAGREVTLLCDQGVISAAGYHRGQIGKEWTVAVQCDLACLAVHQVCCTDDRSAERLTDGLMSQTHAQHGELSAEAANRLYRDTGILGIARPRREDQRLRC